MYAAAAAAPPTRPISQIAIPSILILVSVVIAFVLIIAMVVLALIPLYLPDRSSPPDPNLQLRREMIMGAFVEENDAVNIGRRKRAPGDLARFVSGEFDAAGRQMLRERFLPFLTPVEVGDINVTSAVLGYINVGRRKRFPLSKRATYSGNEIVLVIKFLVTFRANCFLFCQNRFAPLIQKALYNIILPRFDFRSVRLFIKGGYQIAPRIKFYLVLYVSLIIPGLTPTIPVFPVNSTQTSTTTSTTTTITTTTTTPVSATPAVG